MIHFACSLFAVALLLVCRPIHAQQPQPLDAGLSGRGLRPLGGSGEAEAGTAEYHFREGLLYYERGELEKALKQFKSVARLSPKNAAPHFNLGILYGEMGQLDVASKEFDEALKLNPDNAAAQFNRGVIFMKQNKHQEAISAFEKALILVGSDELLHYNLAVCYEYADGERYGPGFNREKCIFHYGQALKIKPDNAIVHFNLGMLYVHVGELEPAEEELRRTIEIDPGMADAFLQIGLLMLKKENYHSALNNLTKAKRIDENLSVKEHLIEARSGLGQFFLQNGDYEEARRNFEEVLELDPSSVQSMVRLSHAYSGLQNYSDAVKYLNRALSLDESLPLRGELAEIYYLWGNQLERDGRYEMAAQEYENSLRLEQGNADCYKRLGRLFHFKLGNRGKAIHYYRKALAIGLPMAEGDKIRRLIAEAVRREDRLVNRYRALVKNNPGNATLRYNLAVFYQERGNVSEAINEYRRAIRLNPGNCFAHYNLGLLYAKRRKMSEAIREFKSALSHCPGYARADYALGMVYEGLGDYSKARNAYEKALADEAEFADAHLALTFLLDRKLGDTAGAKFHLKKYKELVGKK